MGFLRAQVADSILHSEVKISAQRISEAIGSYVAEADKQLYKLVKSRSLTEVLQTQDFISIRANSPGGIANFSLRGTGSQHTQVLWEGIPINDPMLGQTDISTISLSGSSSVRILYGAAGLTNSSGGIGGTLELISQSRRQKDGFDGKVNLYAGSFGTYGCSLQFGERRKILFGNTSFEFQTSKNNFTFRNSATLTKDEQTMEHAHYQRIGLTRSMGLFLNERNTLKASFYFAQVERELPPTMQSIATQEELFDRDIWAALNWRRLGNRSNFILTSAYIYGKQEYTNNQEYTFHHLYQANKNLLRYELDLDYNLYLKFGVDIFNETAKSDSAYNNKTYYRLSQAAFASLRYLPKKWLSAQVLIREDIIDGGLSPLQGLVGLEVEPLDWFFLKGNLANNFRSPTLNDLYWNPGGNPDLKSETGFSWEAGLGFKVNSKAIDFEAGANYFQSEIDNWIIWLPNGSYWTPQNKRTVSSRGVELRCQFSKSVRKFEFHLNGSYTFVQSRVKEGISENDASIGKQLIYVPEHVAKGSLSFYYGDVFLLYQHQFEGMRYISSDNTQALPSFQIGRVALGYDYSFTRHVIGISASLDNIFDAEYQMIAWRPMPGRSFMINLTYQFK
jgi:iron complex outermembrane receptor protein